MTDQSPEPTEAKRTTLFLSYAHDDEVRARRLAKALQQAGYSVWWDDLIEGGTAYAKSINSALEAADVVVVLWSAASVESDWVRDEAALGRDRHRLVPLSLDGTRPPLGFRQYQFINFRNWRGRMTARQFVALERAIAAAIGQEAKAPARSARRVSRRTMMLAGGAAVAVAVGGGAFLAFERGLFSGGDEPLSIAVLPFKNLSGDPEQNYFSEGLTEEVRAGLVRLDALRVAAATSSEVAGERQGDLKSIARELGVGFLLGGSVRRSGDIVRIATELTDGKTGFGLWSKSVDRRMTDIFAVQAEIARMVAQALSIQIATDQPAPGGTRQVDAYEHYLKGRSLYNLAKDEQSDRQALAHFDLAIATDPNFAMAHAARSRLLASIASTYASARDLKPLYNDAIAEARRAVELAPTMAEGQLALGYALFAGRLDVRGARPFYDKAYQYGRGNADILLLYALYSVRSRRFAQAREAIDRALMLDPINPRAHRAAGTVAYASKRYADAVAEYRRSLELNPAMTNAHALMGDSLMELGKVAEARAAYAAEPAAMFRLRGLAVLEHRVGNQPAAKQAYGQLVSEVGDAALYQQAEVLAQWGQTAEALAKLDQARKVGDSGLSLIVTDPLLDPLRRDPRFINLIKQLGFD
ncbi:MAG: TIR domain-containing protein [Sphingomicrobium sp.]